MVVATLHPGNICGTDAMQADGLRNARLRRTEWSRINRLTSGDSRNGGRTSVVALSTKDDGPSPWTLRPSVGAARTGAPAGNDVREGSAAASSGFGPFC